MRSGPVQHRSWPDCPPLRWCLGRRNTRCQVHTLSSFAHSTSAYSTDSPPALLLRSETEDALIAFIEAEQTRDALHAKTKQEIAAKYNQQDRLGGAA
jgi:hypothetical protein